MHNMSIRRALLVSTLLLIAVLVIWWLVFRESFSDRAESAIAEARTELIEIAESTGYEITELRSGPAFAGTGTNFGANDGAPPRPGGAHLTLEFPAGQEPALVIDQMTDALIGAGYELVRDQCLDTGTTALFANADGHGIRPTIRYFAHEILITVGTTLEHERTPASGLLMDTIRDEGCWTS